MRILICEDQWLQSADLAMRIEELGHEVCGTARDSATCLKLFGDLRPDVVTVDFLLADGTTGPDIVRTLVESGAAVIIATGQMAAPGDFGACASITKPFDNRDLARALDRVQSARGLAAPPG